MSTHRAAATTLIFLHIPKAAGTTVHHVLDRQFAPDQVYSLAGDAWARYRQEFRQLPPERKRRIRVVKGHLEFGFHEMLEQASTYVTVLRHPVDRIMSYYYYVLATPAHYLYKAVATARMGLVDFAWSGLTTELDNGQVRLLTATAIGVPPGQMHAGHLELAKENMRRWFAVVGVQEQMDFFLWRLAEQFRLPTALVPPQNVTRDRPAIETLSTRDYQLLRERNSLDDALYQFAKEQVAAQQAGLDTLARARYLFFQMRLKLASQVKSSYPYKLAAGFYRQAFGRGKSRPRAA